MATNLRKGLFTKIESFCLRNTDHFTTPSLITRLTNDVNNIQNSFQMIIRISRAHRSC
jgi:ATP-binding cassette subfamily B protein